MAKSFPSLFGIILAIGVLAARSRAAEPTSRPVDPVRLILLTQSKGFVHDVVKRKDGAPSIIERTFSKLAEESKLFAVEWTDDAATLTDRRLAGTRVAMFYTSGDIPLDVKALHAWVEGGGLECWETKGFQALSARGVSVLLKPKAIGSTLSGTIPVLTSESDELIHGETTSRFFPTKIPAAL